MHGPTRLSRRHVLQLGLAAGAACASVAGTHLWSAPQVEVLPLTATSAAASSSIAPADGARQSG